MEFVIHPGALEELVETAEFYDERRKGLGDEFLAAVEDAFDQVFENPETGFAFEDLARMCRVKRFPFGVVFIHERNVISIVAVAHLSRRPGFWADRINE